MKRTIETAQRVAPSESTVLLGGETGTGKSVFARAIHSWSSRSGKPMTVISCPTIPSELLESELFGQACAHTDTFGGEPWIEYRH